VGESAIGEERMGPEPETRQRGSAAPDSPYPKLKPRRGSPRDEVARHQRLRIRRAMVELVAVEGYEAVKVSELATRARISTRDFYRHSHGKQDCLLDAHDWIMRQAAWRLDDAAASGRDPRERTRMALEALAGMLSRHSIEARLACVESAAAGLGILERRCRSAEELAAVVVRCVGGYGRGQAVPRTLAMGIVAGITQVVVSLLIAGREDEFPTFIPDLVRWISDLTDPRTSTLSPGRSARGAAAAASALFFDRPVDTGEELAARERRQILVGTLAVASEAGYWQLTVPRIRAAVGISRARFDAYYDGVEDCFAAAIGLVATRAMDFAAETAAGQGEEWPRGFHRGVEALCAYTAREPMIARLALVEILAAGPRGLRDLTGIIKMTAERLRDEVPITARPAAVAAEASMGAVFGLVHRAILNRQLDRIGPLAPYLSYLVLTPAIGPRDAIGAISATPDRGPIVSAVHR
jgi:AcrR family transcriptional regulator